MIILLEVTFSLLMIYLTAGCAVYLYAAVENYQIIDKWVFKVSKTHVGVVRYPKWLMWWIYQIGVMTNGYSKRK